MGTTSASSPPSGTQKTRQKGVCEHTRPGEVFIPAVSKSTSTHMSITTGRDEQPSGQESQVFTRIKTAESRSKLGMNADRHSSTAAEPQSTIPHPNSQGGVQLRSLGSDPHRLDPRATAPHLQDAPASTHLSFNEPTRSRGTPRTATPCHLPAQMSPRPALHIPQSISRHNVPCYEGRKDAL